MKLTALAIMLVTTLVSACTPSAQAVQTAIAQTQAANPTITVTSSKTNTPLPSPTQTPAFTATPRSTPTRTLTPTKTLTPTPRTPVQVDRRDFTTYPDRYTGEYVVVSGIVFNINGNTELQLWMGGDYDSPVYVISAEPFDRIYEGDDVVVFGTASGNNCGTNTYGSSICSATIVDACIAHTIYVSSNVKKDKKGVRPTPDYTIISCP